MCVLGATQKASGPIVIFRAPLLAREFPFHSFRCLNGRAHKIYALHCAALAGLGFDGTPTQAWRLLYAFSGSLDS